MFTLTITETVPSSSGVSEEQTILQTPIPDELVERLRANILDYLSRVKPR